MAASASSAVEDELPPMEPTLTELFDSDGLRWVFVGGKGGVGKTTTSCSVGLRLAARGKRVLLVSTDPAHNLSDAFGQKFGSVPTPVSGADGLSCLEADHTDAIMQAKRAAAASGAADPSGPASGISSFIASEGLGDIIADIMASVPGLDEAMSFVQMLGLVSSMDYDVVVFDTAPTGHTLRLLALPDTMTKGMEAAFRLKDRMGPLLGMAAGLMGGGDDPVAKLTKQLEGIQASVADVRALLTDPVRCTFVCVCIPEFLSLYETERLVQELGKHQVDVANVVVNQVLWRGRDAAAVDPCEACGARRRVQGRYLEQMTDLYEDFHLVRMPAMRDEVRGVEALQGFARWLDTPYEPEA